MTTTIDTLKQALDALRHGATNEQKNAAAMSLRALIEQMEKAEPVAKIVEISGMAGLPALRWLSADHSFRAPIGSLLYPVAPDDRKELVQKLIECRGSVKSDLLHTEQMLFQKDIRYTAVLDAECDRLRALLDCIDAAIDSQKKGE